MQVVVSVQGDGKGIFRSIAKGLHNTPLCCW